MWLAIKSWLRILIGRPYVIVELPRLVRMVVHTAACEVCRKPLKDGDLLIKWEHYSGSSPKIEERYKTKERLVFAHAECLVVNDTTPKDRPRHDKSMWLSEEEFAAWVALWTDA